MLGGVKNWGQGCNHPRMSSHPKLAHLVAVIDTFLLVSDEDYLSDLIPVILLKVGDARNGLEVVVAVGLCQNHRAVLGPVVRLKTDRGHASVFGRGGDSSLLPPPPQCLSQGCIRGADQAALAPV